MSVFKAAGRYARTLRYLGFRQVAWRARYAARRMLRRHPQPGTPPGDIHWHGGTRAALRRFAQDLARAFPGGPPPAEAIRRGRITFSGHTESVSKEWPWRRADFPRLWRYHLHGFDHLLPIIIANALAPRAEDGRQVRDSMEDWIARNPMGSDVAWDAFPLAQRLMHWALAVAVFDIEEPQILDSTWQQAHYLAESLEFDLRANHLLQNAVGLAVGGRMLGDPLWETGARVLAAELSEQILPDGGHYERSPMYHCHALFWGLLAQAVLEGEGSVSIFSESGARAALGKMADWLASVLHGDGDIPLFGDAALGETIAPEALIRLTSARLHRAVPDAPQGSHGREASGFYVLGPKDGSARMIVKAGPPGPAYQLGHAHCDMLSYEFSAGAQRLIVDSGVHGYAGSAWRGYNRSTRGHNTVCVNGREQMECWSMFRVGRRYTPVRHFWGENKLGWRLCASHDGFRPFRHQRNVLFTKAGFWLVADEVAGPGACRAESYIHAHPEAGFEAVESGWEIVLGGHRFRVIPYGQTSARVMYGAREPLQGWYSPRFGSVQAAPVLVLESEDGSRLRFGYAIVPSDGPVPGVEALMEYSDQLAESETLPQ